MTEQTALERTVTALRSEVLNADFSPGEQLVQEAIAERYGVSRVPVREALQVLATEGLVSYYPNRGYFVTELSLTDLLEVYRLRQILESEALANAVPMLTDEDVDHIDGLCAMVDAAAAEGDVEALSEANRRMHFAVFGAAGMPRLMRLLQQLWDASDAYRSLYFEQRINRERVRREHAEMVAALRARDVTASIAIHDAHRQASVDWVTATIARSGLTQKV